MLHAVFTVLPDFNSHLNPAGHNAALVIESNVIMTTSTLDKCMGLLTRPC